MYILLGKTFISQKEHENVSKPIHFIMIYLKKYLPATLVVLVERLVLCLCMRLSVSLSVCVCVWPDSNFE